MDRTLAALGSTVSAAVGLLLRVVLGLFAVVLAISVALSALIIGAAVTAWALLRGRRAGPVRFAWAGGMPGAMRGSRARPPQHPVPPRAVRGDVVDVEAREVPEQPPR